MREAAGVVLDGRQLTYRGEVLIVSVAVAQTIAHLIDALHRREEIPTRLQFGRYTLDLTTGWLCDTAGERVHFPPSCARIVARLMAQPGATVTRAKLAEFLYRNDPDRPADTTVSVFIFLLRDLLRVHNIALSIQTVRGYGMRLVVTKEPAL